MIWKKNKTFYYFVLITSINDFTELPIVFATYCSFLMNSFEFSLFVRRVQQLENK